MATTYIKQFQCDHCETISSSSASWVLFELQRQINIQSIDFCPVCIASLGEKELMKEWIDASDFIPGLS